MNFHDCKDDEHDNRIKIKVRTGTSERPAEYKSPVLRQQPVIFSSYIPIFSLTSYLPETRRTLNDDYLRYIILQSFEDNELKRNDSVVLSSPVYPVEEIDLSKNCTICSENYVKEEYKTILSCNHVFHYNCMKEWVKYSQTCPICRNKVSCVN